MQDTGAEASSQSRPQDEYPLSTLVRMEVGDKTNTPCSSMQTKNIISSMHVYCGLGDDVQLHITFLNSNVEGSVLATHELTRTWYFCSRHLNLLVY